MLYVRDSVLLSHHMVWDLTVPYIMLYCRSLYRGTGLSYGCRRNIAIGKHNIADSRVLTQTVVL